MKSSMKKPSAKPAKQFFKTGGKQPAKPTHMRTSTAAKQSFLKGYK